MSHSASKGSLVSVVVASYNRAGMLPDAMQSVCEQTYRPIELVIVDDGSTDATEDVVAAFRESNLADPRFTVRYVRQENAGFAAARNRGVSESSGDFIQFLDSDDWLLPDKLSCHVSLVNDGSLDFVYSPVRVEREGKLLQLVGWNLRPTDCERECALPLAGYGAAVSAGRVRARTLD